MTGIAWCGVDVAKGTLVACVVREGAKPQLEEFGNRAAEQRKLMAWAKGRAKGSEVRFCIEATGRHSRAVAELLDREGEWVSLVNPRRIKGHRVSMGVRNKNDLGDARVVADFAQERKPRRWRAPSAAERRLQELMQGLARLEKSQQQWKLRQGEPGMDALVRQSMRVVLKTLAKQIERLQQAIAAHLAENRELAVNERLLRTITGVGKKTASWFLATVGDGRRFTSAKAVAAFVGLHPCEQESGTSVHGPSRIARTGGAMLRKVLYMAAQSAMRHNPVIRAFVERLQAQGRLCKKAILVAAMHKLVRICYGVCKSQTAFRAA